MGRLKKLKASSLNEVVIATVIIVMVFAIGSAVLVNVLTSMAHNRRGEMEQTLNKLIYEYEHQLLKLPYRQKETYWTIHVTEEEVDANRWVIFEIETAGNRQQLKRKIVAYEKS